MMIIFFLGWCYIWFKGIMGKYWVFIFRVFFNVFLFLVNYVLMMLYVILLGFSDFKVLVFK